MTKSSFVVQVTFKGCLMLAIEALNWVRSNSSMFFFVSTTKRANHLFVKLSVFTETYLNSAIDILFSRKVYKH